MNRSLALVAIVGMPGAGKSVAADFFRTKGIPVLRFGDQTDKGLMEQGKPLTEENERIYREQIRSELGMAAMATKIEPRIIETAKTSPLIVLDGLYSWEEYVYLKQKFSQIQLLCIYAPPSLRYERLASRVTRPIAKEEAQRRDIAEIEHLNKGGPIALANVTIVNDAGEKALLDKLEEFYKTLL